MEEMNLNQRMALRPQGIPELLDTTLRLYRQHFWLLIGLVAVVQVPLTLISSLYESWGASGTLSPYYSWDNGTPQVNLTDVLTSFLGAMVLLLLTAIFLYGLANAAVTRVVYDRYLGRPVGFWETYRALGRRWLRLAGAILLVFLLNFVLLFVFFFFSLVLGFIPCINLLLIPLLIAMLLFFIYINVSLWSPLAGVVVVEDLGVLSSVGRAFRLGRHKFWRVLGFNIVLGLLLGVFMWALPVLLGLLIGVLQPSFEVQQIMISAISLSLSSLVLPPLFCGLALLYFDLRVRLEGFDMELEMQRTAVEGTSFE